MGLLDYNLLIFYQSEFFVWASAKLPQQNLFLMSLDIFKMPSNNAVVLQILEVLETKIEKSVALNLKLAALKASPDLLSPAKANELKKFCNEVNLGVSKYDKTNERFDKLMRRDNIEQILSI